ncbi:MAG: hypothetical protein HY268_15545 [Deltaproteobacteria bacterium]|nr:hypothetical protein [Deltaproteobacteria bacterium]
MSSPDEHSVRAVFDIYTEPGVEWQVRFLGTHLHPGFEGVGFHPDVIL